MPPIAPPEISYKDKVLEASRRKYGRPREKIEEDIAKEYESPKQEQKREQKAREQPQRPQKPRERESFGGKPAGTSIPSRIESKDVQAPKQKVQPVMEKKPEMEFSPHKEQLGRIAEQMKGSSNDSDREGQHQKKEISRKKDSKGITEESRAELRDALAGVLKNESAKAPKHNPESKESKPRADESNQNKKASPAGQKEIPEDELRKMLDVSE